MRRWSRLQRARRSLSRAIATGCICALGAAACAPNTAGGVSRAAASVSLHERPPIDVAMRTAHDLGQFPADQQLGFRLTLSGRDPAGLQALLASGGRVTPGQFAGRYAPDPASVARVERTVVAAGLNVTWHAGDAQLQVVGPAAASERFLGVAVHNFLTSDGLRFHAPRQRPEVPRAVAPDVIAVTGLDDYPRALTAALSPMDTNGVTPQDMMSFYDIKPLRDAGLDGTGQTVVFLDWGMPSTNVLQAFAQKFTPTTPFNVDVHQDATAWGAPLMPGDKQYGAVAGETALDLEMVHGIAPGAHEVVYQFGTPSAIPAVIKAIAAQFPGAIISSSIGQHECEHESGSAQDGMALDAAESAAAAQGTSIFWASGDRGAYGCLPLYPNPDSNAPSEVSVSPDNTPSVTTVGGTTVFLAQNGAYFQESAWGEPVEQWGGGGGVSTVFPRPSWQQAPGVAAGMTGRGVPDISANSDVISGWDIVGPDPRDPSMPAEGPVGGTSAAAPFWAAITALIDQDLANKKLPSVGFANPALYLFAQAPAGLPAPPFHDVTLGTNLHYAAAPGWDAATGLGTPDVAALADDFEWYRRTHGSAQ